MINLEKIRICLRLLTPGHELYDDLAVAEEQCPDSAGKPYRRLRLTAPDTEILISEHGGVTWNGPLDWNLIDVIDLSTEPRR